MSIRVYNTLSREKEPFEPVTPGAVGIYLCGPTVYKPPHIGHLVGPVIFDAIKRYLVFRGYRVRWVVNITDVDDKIIHEAAARGIDFRQLAVEQTGLYLGVLSDLGVRESIDDLPRASEHMRQIVAVIETLIDKKHAYATPAGDVWFDVQSDPGYGKLSNRKLADAEAGTRTLEGQGKKHAADFALWKAVKPAKEGQPTEPTRDSPRGPGRPGWHIECSAMSQAYLGDTFDIHGGGDDLKFPHHENELAQSECCTGKPLAKYWLHNGLTRIKTKAASGEWKSEKMSKSLGNTVGARELLTAHGADVLRYLLLSTHYRSPIEFSDDVLANTKKALGVFTRLFERVERLGATALPAPRMPTAQPWALNDTSRLDALSKPYVEKFTGAMDDDFNTAGAIAAMHELAGVINAEIEKTGVEQTAGDVARSRVTAAAAALKSLGGILGLFLVESQPTPADEDAVEKLMSLIISLRQTARKEKNFAMADAIRNGLTEIGITLEDQKDGTAWRKN
jgi:cysteinyl-tRNA synthetase